MPSRPPLVVPIILPPEQPVFFDPLNSTVFTSNDPDLQSLAALTFDCRRRTAFYDVRLMTESFGRAQKYNLESWMRDVDNRVRGLGEDPWRDNTCLPFFNSHLASQSDAQQFWDQIEPPSGVLVQIKTGTDSLRKIYGNNWINRPLVQALRDIDDKKKDEKNRKTATKASVKAKEEDNVEKEEDNVENEQDGDTVREQWPTSGTSASAQELDTGSVIDGSEKGGKRYPTRARNAQEGFELEQPSPKRSKPRRKRSKRKGSKVSFMFASPLDKVNHSHYPLHVCTIIFFDSGPVSLSC